METTFRTNKLEDAIHNYGLSIDKSIKWNNEKRIKLLGDYQIKTRPEEYSWTAHYVQSLNSFMLYSSLNKEIKKLKENPMISETYVEEKEFKGLRVLVGYSPEVGFEIFSRYIDTYKYLNTNLTKKFLFIDRGLISTPSDYKNTFKYRFVLDAELVLAIPRGISSIAISMEDYIYSILNNNAQQAYALQKSENIKIIINDVLFFDKSPNIETDTFFYYEYGERKLNPEDIIWVGTHFKSYLDSAGFTKGVSRYKLLYSYLFSLKESDKCDIRKYTFMQRRELRKKIVDFLKEKGLPFLDAFYTNYTCNNSGIVLKNKFAPYVSALGSSRSHRAVLRVPSTKI